MTNSWPSPGAAVGGGAAAMTPTRRGDLTLRATAGLTATALDMATYTGHTCSNPKEGHQPTTTRNNIMGGSIANKDWTPNKAT